MACLIESKHFAVLINKEIHVMALKFVFNDIEINLILQLNLCGVLQAVLIHVLRDYAVKVRATHALLDACIAACSTEAPAVPPRSRKHPERGYAMVARRRNSEVHVLRPTKREKWLNPQSLAARLATTCCAQSCMSHCTMAELQASIATNLDGSECNVTSSTSSYLIANAQQSRPANAAFLYKIKGRTVCRTAFMLFHGITDWKLREAQKNARAGTSESVHVAKGMQRPKIAYAYVLGWITSWFDQVALF